MITTCVPSNEKGWTLLVKNYATDVQAMMCADDEVLQEHCFVEDFMHEEHS